MKRTLTGILLSLLCAPPVAAQSFPVKPVRLVSAFPPGGGGDAVARLIAQPLSEQLGQQVVVETRAGASGLIGTAAVAKSVPDGYTMTLGSVAPIAILPAATPNMVYDPLKDLQPISLLATSDYVLTVHPSLPAKSVKELIALANANPGKLTYASSGTLGGPHLAGELFKSLANVGITHVPYRGGLPSFTDVLSGQVAMTFTTPAIAIQHIQSGRLLALGVTSLRRISVFPDLPTIVENGLPGFVVDNWYGVLYPADTSAQIIEKTCDDVNSLLQADTVRRQLLVQGVEPIGSTSREFADVIKRDIAKWEKVVKNIKLQVD